MTLVLWGSACGILAASASERQCSTTAYDVYTRTIFRTSDLTKTSMHQAQSWHRTSEIADHSVSLSGEDFVSCKISRWRFEGGTVSLLLTEGLITSCRQSATHCTGFQSISSLRLTRHGCIRHSCFLASASLSLKLGDVPISVLHSVVTDTFRLYEAGTRYFVLYFCVFFSNVSEEM